MTSDYNNNMAIAMSGKTARPCDYCAKKRARWYCAADDAFLCQSCDGTVHSANPLARRHERVLLKTVSFKQPDRLPFWHRGLTKKPRTPRHAKNNSTKSASNNNMTRLHPVHMVPDLGIEENTSFSSSHGDDEEQLLFQVPVYDPFVTEFCTSTTTSTLEGKNDHQFTIKLPHDGYLPSGLELEEFAADVETLLGKGLDDEIYGIEELGLLDHSPNNNKNNIININIDDDDDEKEHDDIVYFGRVVKEENGGEIIKKCDIEIENDELGFRVPFELSFDGHDFPRTCEYQQGHHRDEMMVEDSSLLDGISKHKNDYELCKLERIDDDDFDDNKEDYKVLINNKCSKVLLRLDYEAISEAWASQGSPWMNGQRPEISLDDSWPHFMGGSGTMAHHTLSGETQLGGVGGNRGVGDEGREARVSRYREKRRTRLFSKKIRYEVRKLNAEKRPRMKGRFVKRSSFAPSTTTFPFLSKK